MTWATSGSSPAASGTQSTLQNLAGTQDVILALNAVSATEVWLTGRDVNTWQGLVYHTTDAGATWQKEIVGEYPYIPVGVSARPGGSVWIAGYSGRVQHLPGSTVSVPMTGNPAAVSYLGQVVPNPFRSEASIRFALPADGWLDLQILDVTGRTVASLASGRVRAGAQTHAWAPRAGRGSAPDVGAGVYFCYVADRSPSEGSQASASSAHVETRKLLYMR